MISSSWKVDIDQAVNSFNVQQMLWLTAVAECNVTPIECNVGSGFSAALSSLCGLTATE